jgi:hypothetical protein
VLTGRRILEGINLPAEWRVSLHWKSGKGRAEVRDKLDGAAFATALQECLRDRPTYSRLDGGPFGSLEWQAPPSPPVRSCRRLPPALADRLRWLRSTRLSLASQNGLDSSAVGMGVPPDSVERVAAPDRNLVAEFIATKAWPGVLLPQARSVARDLIRYLQPTS